MLSLQLSFGLILAGSLVVAIAAVACSVLIALRRKARDDVGETISTTVTRKSFDRKSKPEKQSTVTEWSDPSIDNREERKENGEEGKEEADKESQQDIYTHVPARRHLVSDPSAASVIDRVDEPYPFVDM